MNTVITFILFLYGSPLHQDTKLVAYVAEFDDRDTCETVAAGLKASPPRNVGNPPTFQCLESTETHTLTH